jgi:hypothetical protein
MGNTQNGINNISKDAVDWTATGLDVVGTLIAFAGESHIAALYKSGFRRGISGNYLLTGRNLSLFGNSNMTTASIPTSWLIGIGSTISKGVTVTSAGLLLYEANEVRLGQMDRGRFGYHLGSFGAAIGVGSVFGGPAGVAVGLAAKSGEMGYDISKQAYYTLNGQWNNFVQSIINASGK